MSKRWRAIGWSVALVVVCFAVWFVTAFVQVTAAAEASLSPSLSRDESVIVVLGAAQYNGEPSPVLEQRLEKALELWNNDQATPIVTTGANQPGDTFTEGFAAFRYLRNAGVPEAALIVVVDGGDTYESLLATANQLSEDQSEVLLVTDAYHALRSAEVAAEVGLAGTVVASSDEATFSRRVREAAAISLGRIVGYRRLSAWR